MLHSSAASPAVLVLPRYPTQPTSAPGVFLFFVRSACSRRPSEVVGPDACPIPLYPSGASIHTHWALSACYLFPDCQLQGLVGECHSLNNETFILAIRVVVDSRYPLRPRDHKSVSNPFVATRTSTPTDLGHILLGFSANNCH